MKLGVSYNVFDGEELLEGSINCIRNNVDYISVVYQTISNLGNPSNADLEDKLFALKDKGLIDELQKYKPSIYNGFSNEVQKRNIGLLLSRKNKCTHHMSMDADEYYIENEFVNMKQVIDDGDYDGSYCQMLSYYKTWDYFLDPPEDYYVSLIFKIKDVCFYSPLADCKLVVDPTRKMTLVKNPKIFSRSELQMHHGSYIRDNIRLKLENSSAIKNYHVEIDYIVNYYNNWEYPQPAVWAGLPSKVIKLKQNDNTITQFSR